MLQQDSDVLNNNSENVSYSFIDFKVKKFQKSSQGKEKEVDTALTYDICEVVTENRGRAGTFFIITGDRDYIYSIKQMLKNGFLVKLYSWKSCLSNSFHELANVEEHLTIEYLDDILEQFPDAYFLEAEWNVSFLMLYSKFKIIPIQYQT